MSDPESGVSRPPAFCDAIKKSVMPSDSSTSRRRIGSLPLDGHLVVVSES